jgi:hypothetical protein
VRSSDLVMVMSIVGVPWQDVARLDHDGNPDLGAGLDASGAPVGGVMRAGELRAAGRFEVMLGDPAVRRKPSDPLMIESIEPRQGEHPIIGAPLAPPSSGVMANPINGHEYTVKARDDLQYACIFPIPTPRDCTGLTPDLCECAATGTDNPICQSGDQQFESLQRYAKAQPGLRHLELSQRLGDRSVVSSVCAAQLDDPQAGDFGYRPAVRTLLELVAERLP